MSIHNSEVVAIINRIADLRDIKGDTLAGSGPLGC